MAIIESMNPMSISEAAKRMGVSVERMRALARGGRVAAHKTGHRWVIEKSPLVVDRKAGVRFLHKSPGQPSRFCAVKSPDGSIQPLDRVSVAGCMTSIG
jgi:excisionase family DNA binding protein